jgi:hypothetical protein
MDQEYYKCCAYDLKLTGTQPGRRFFGETSRKAEPGAGNRDHIRLVEVKMLMWRGALVLLLWSLTISRGANILFFHNMGTKYDVHSTQYSTPLATEPEFVKLLRSHAHVHSLESISGLLKSLQFLLSRRGQWF